MNRITKLLFVAFIIASVAAAPDSLRINHSGEKLKQFYLGLNVENLWIAGQHINWDTGQADNPDATHNIKTHCSSFVAAACKKLEIYILRPPEHKQTLLANAQYDWLFSNDAAAKGWKRITGNDLYETAQAFANNGYVVVAICKNPNEYKPGHAALVMPSEISTDSLTESGPRLITAGAQNYNSVSLRTGFRHHLNGWPESSVSFFYNEKKPFQ